MTRPLPARPATRVVAVVALAIAASGLAGCRLAASEPSARPVGFPALSRIVGPAGVLLEDPTSGDAGCDDPSLAANAISLTASGLDQETPVRIHLYRFKNESALQESLGAVSTCATSYVVDPDGFELLVVPPYVLAGQGPWGEAFEATLTAGLERAAVGDE